MHERYKALCHAMQSGVAAEIAKDDRSVQLKHLRVGINVALCDHSALVQLLIEKGVVTSDEYLARIVAEMEAEVQRYEARLEKMYGAKITLH